MATGNTRQSQRERLTKAILNNRQLYLFLLPAFAYFLIFHYLPMYGVQIAFRNFNPARGITGSEWVGLKHILRFFESYHFWRLIRNTLSVSVYTLALGFPIPIVLALMLNEMQRQRYKRIIQTVIYAPHFISVVVMAGMVLAFLKSPVGLLNQFRGVFGMDTVSLLTSHRWFSSIYAWSGVWQQAGWGTVIYLAALSSIDPEIYEAAIIDGASRMQRVFNINLPGIIPMVMIILIMNTGRIMSVGFEKAFLLQNPLNLESSEIISTYVYKAGLQSFQYSFASAVGLVNSVVNFILLFTVNRIAKRAGQASLW